MPTLTVSIASPLTRVTNPLTHQSSLSTAGHVWITLTDANNNPHSFGFAPVNYQHAMVAPGQVYDDDNKNYASTSFVKTINISQSDYDKLFAFDNAARYAAPESTVSAGGVHFRLHYNAFSNSCVDFVWTTLSVIGIEQPLNTIGEDRLPIWNTSDLTAVLDVYQRSNGSGTSGGTGSHTPPLSSSLSSSPLLLFNKAQAQALDATKGSRVVSYDELDGDMRIAYVNGSKESIVSSVGDAGNTALTDTLIQADGSEIKGTIVVDANFNPVCESITNTCADGRESSVTDTYENGVVTQTITVITDTDGVTKNSTKTYVEGGIAYDEHTIYTAADGRMLEEAWQMQDGSSHSTTNNVNGTSWTTTNDGHGNTDRTLFGSDGGKLSDVWSKSDEGSGTVTFYANGQIASECIWTDSFTRHVYNLNGTYSYFNAYVGAANPYEITNYIHDLDGATIAYATIPSNYGPGKLYRADGTELSFDHTNSTYAFVYGGNGTTAISTTQYPNGQITRQYYRVDAGQLHCYAVDWAGPEGSGSETRDANGITITNDWWDMPDGSYGSYKRDIMTNASTLTSYKGDGSHITDTTISGVREVDYYDVRGNLYVKELSGNGQDIYTHYQADGSYDTVTNDSIGYGEYQYDGITGTASRHWTYVDGGRENTTFYSNGSVSEKEIVNTDGSSVGTKYAPTGTIFSTATDDGHGNLLTNYFDTNGVKTSDSWQHANGDYGYDDFDSTGKKVSDSWHHYDGSEGSDTFNADGSFSSSTADSQGNCKTSCFDSDGMLVSDNWTQSDGSYGAYTLNADNSSLATTINTDGSTIFVANDGRGNSITTQYDRNGKILNDTWTKADGSHGSDSFNADGSSVAMTVSADGSSVCIADDGKGHIVTTQFDDKGTKLSDTWISADGSHGTDSFNADGSSIATTINADGSSSRIANDGKGLIATILFDNNGIKLSETWSNVDGSHGEIHYDVSGIVTTTIAVDSNGNSAVTGGSGNNTLIGGAGTDTLTGVAGNDILDGGNGSDTYVFRVGDGIDTIQDSGTTGTDTVAFGQGITPDSLSLGLGSLLIKIGAGNDAIHIKNFNPYDVYSSPNIESFKFADGTSLTYNQLLSRGFDVTGSDNDDTFNGTNVVDRLYGLNGNDYLSGGDGDDALDGGTGNDELNGGAGNDTYLFGRGDGKDTILSYDGNQHKRDVVLFKEGIQPSDVVVSRQYFDLILKIAGTQDQLTIQNYFNNEGGFNPYGVEAIQFADGSPAWDYATVKLKSLEGTDGNDWLIGSGGAEAFSGLGGNDYIESRGGDDTLQGNTGADTLYGGEGNDIIDGGTGVDLLYGGAGNDVINGGTDNDSLDGSDGNDILNGEEGSDQLNGGTGDDIYLFGRGDGQDTISRGWNQNLGDVVQFKAGVLSSDVAVRRQDNTLILKIAGTPDQLTIRDYFYGEGVYGLPYGVKAIQFADGSPAWDYAMVKMKSLEATEGNDWLIGTGSGETIAGLGGDDHIEGNDGNDILDGGVGDDLLNGGAGNDIYLFGFGAGHDTVVDYYPDTSTVRMTAEVLPENVAVTRDATSLYLSLNGGTDQLNLSNWFNGFALKELGVEFVSGATWDAAALLARLPGASAGDDWLDGDGGDNVIVGLSGNDQISGESGNDTLSGSAGTDRLYGGEGNDILNGGAGDDYLQGDAGNDAYLFGPGFGLDAVSDYDTTAGNVDTVQMAAGVLPGDVVVTGDRYHLYLGFVDRADKLTLSNWFVDDASKIERVSFADGTVWDAAQLAAKVSATSNLVLTGSVGNDSLDGLGGNDTLFGMGGVDTLAGGAGDDLLIGGYDRDVYLFNLGDGADTIDDAFSYAHNGGYGGAWGGGNGNELRFGAGISPDQIAAISNDGALTLEVRGTSDSVRLLHWVGGMDRVDTFVFADGTVWDAAHVESIMTPNVAPQVQTPIGHYDATQAQAMTFRIPDITFFDANPSDTLRLSVQLEDGNQLPSWLYFNAATHTLYGTPGGSDVGTYRIRVTASDPQGVTIADVFDLAVAKAMNTAPVVALPVSDQSVAEDVSFNYTVPAGTFADVDVGDRLTLSATLASGSPLPSWLKFDAATATFSGSPGIGSLADYSVRVTARDLAGATAATTFNLSVKAGGVTLHGTSGADKLTGFSGNDSLDGGAGADTLIGGKGNDTYRVDSAKDKVVESKDEGNDTIIAAIDYDLPENVENLVLTGKAGLKGTGNSLDNTLTTSTSGNDVLSGEKGDDTYYVNSAKDRVVERKNEGKDTIIAAIDYDLPDNAENLVFTGTAGRKGTGNNLDNVLNGTVGNDSLDGDSGADTLFGGAGNDSYAVDDVDDRVVELVGEGIDSVVSSIGYILPDNVENLTLTGGKNNDHQHGGDSNDHDDGGHGLNAMSATGNALANTIMGNADANILDGGAGADRMLGGDGNDSYSVDNAADVVIEDKGDGIDSVVAMVSYVLTSNVENLTLAGADAINGIGNASSNVLTGNSNVNLLSGGAGNDSLNGSGGLDFLEGMVGNDTLADSAGSGYFNGGTGDDKLSGGALADFFIGGKGDDAIATGGGNDVIVFNRGDGYDKVTVGANGGVTLSLGGGIVYSDLKFKKSGNDLVLQTDNDGEGIEFADWYARSAKHNVLNLQVVAEAMAGFDAASANPLLSKKVQDFDFAGLAGAFDTARAAKPSLSSWTLASALTQFHLASSDSSALGGDLAYQYGKNGTLSGIGLASAQTVIGDAQFGAQAQALKPLSGLQEGAARLG